MDEILSKVSPVYGFCSFNKIDEHLIDCRGKVKLPEKAKTVIVFLFPYYLGDDAYNDSDISKYAVVPDYHDVLIPLLENACNELKARFPNDEFVMFADNSPIPEVYAAVMAGLGVKGKNGLFISKEYGSWVFIGDIVTTLEITPANPTELFCIGCNKCVEACPTESIKNYGIIKETCLSHITQRKGTLTQKEINLIRKSNCLWGCDICQNVCPMNFDKKTKPLDIFKSDVKLKADAEDIDGRAYAWRGKKTIERNINILYDEKGEKI